MPGFRLTKYDPRLRDADGAYRVDDWTSISDVGRIFAGRALTADDYQRVEDAYVAAISAAHEDCGAPALFARDVESRQEFALAEHEPLAGPRLAEVIRGCLRELVWCRIESDDGQFSVHFGWDYYAYLTVAHLSARAQQTARDSGLFLEPFESPYQRE